MKKILHYVSIMDRGGQETLIMNIFKAINREKVSFDFLCVLNEKGAYDDEIIALGGMIYHLDLGRFKVPLFDRLDALSVFLHTHGVEYDFFHIHTQHAMDGYLNSVIAKKAGIKNVIVHSHNTNTSYHPFFHRLFKPLLRQSKVIKIACSDAAGKWLFGKNCETIILHNGISIEDYSYSELIRKKVRSENRWDGFTVIGHVGRFDYQKNHFFILEVFREYLKLNPKSILVLVGDGLLRDDIVLNVKKYGLTEHVFLLGIRSDVANLIQGFDLFFFPSLFEGLGISLVEAQCSGLQCLISDVIPYDADVTENTHRMSLSDSALKWAVKMNQIIVSSPIRNNMALEIKKAGYDIKSVAKVLQAIYCKDN